MLPNFSFERSRQAHKKPAEKPKNLPLSAEIDHGYESW
jgi:hypothetical protein